ncbi:MAG: hypothetical protein M5R36_23655 [Deltaproteobacteria bacterium]|nr:hypothetical protein [Deltaproteobacteria bacterium]
MRQGKGDPGLVGKGVPELGPARQIGTDSLDNTAPCNALRALHPGQEDLGHAPFAYFLDDLVFSQTHRRNYITPPVSNRH